MANKTNLMGEIVEIFKSDNPVEMLLVKLWDLIEYLWLYPIFTTQDKQVIHLSNVIISIVLLTIGTRLVKKITKLFKKRIVASITEPGAVKSLENLAYYFLMTLMVVFVLDISKVPLTVFAIVGTTLALGIGLGSQNIVNNFISGLIIMIERPIRVGDVVEVKNIAGEVIDIGARCTSIKTSSNINMLVPNSSILQDVIINWTLEDNILKTSLKLEIEDKHGDIQNTEKLVCAVLNKQPDVLKTPQPKVLLTALHSSGYEIELEFWIDIKHSGGSKKVISDFNRALLPVLKENNLGIIDKV